MRIAAGDLAERGHGRSLLALCEAWDVATERAGAKTVIASVRTLVAEAKGASWADVAGLVGGPVLALRGRGEALPDQYTGSLPTLAKHALDLESEKFNHSGAAGH
ncbi:MAG: hypothetical protein JJE37_03715 [Methyloceanibacter sp.]|nr:hypothetical protein [Methyloceanibacter sp.]